MSVRPTDWGEEASRLLPSHPSPLMEPRHNHCSLWLPPPAPAGQERVKGMVWASYKFPIGVGRVGLLAGRGLGGRGIWEKARRLSLGNNKHCKQGAAVTLTLSASQCWNNTNKPVHPMHRRTRILDTHPGLPRPQVRALGECQCTCQAGLDATRETMSTGE